MAKKPIRPTAQSSALSSIPTQEVADAQARAHRGRSPITPARRVALADGDVRPMTEDEVRSVEAALAGQKGHLAGGPGPGPGQFLVDEEIEIASSGQLSDTLARAHARDPSSARDRVEVPVNAKLAQMRDDLVAAQKAGQVSNWETAMIESMIDLRDLQDVIDAMTARQDVIRENVKLALANGDSKTFKCALGAATLAKGAETVSIVDAKLVPSQFLKTEIDKAKVGRALKVPSVVPGAVLTEGKPSLRISWDDE